MTNFSMNEIFFCFGIAIVIYLLLKECMKMKEGMKKQKTFLPEHRRKDINNRIFRLVRKSLTPGTGATNEEKIKFIDVLSERLKKRKSRLEKANKRNPENSPRR